MIGQSLGGSVAIALGSRHPSAVRALVLVEASPSAEPNAASEVRRWLDGWPSPFPSRESAALWFGGGEAGRAWADGLLEASEGYVAAFEPAEVEAAVQAVTSVDLWPAWRELSCPALAVRGSGGWLSAYETRLMAAANRRASVVVVEGAGHDVHLDRPRQLASAVRSFVEGL